MSRQPRIISSIRMEHVMLRGVNKQTIFCDDADYRKFLKCILKAHVKAEFTVHAYCLMGNHVHLLIHSESEPIGDTVKRFAISYAMYFNRKYERVGHLFQDRFRSVPVENEDSYLRVMRYILRNPVEAGICANVSEYKWSNYHSLGTNDGIADSSLLNTLIDRTAFLNDIESTAEENDSNEISDIDNVKVRETDVAEIMSEESGTGCAQEFLCLDANIQAACIRRMVARGCRVCHIQKLLGVSRRQMDKLRGKTRKE